MFFEMPLITARICGICPVSHHLASAKACDADRRRRAAAPGHAAARADAHGADHPVALACTSSSWPARTCCWASTPIRPSATWSACTRPTRAGRQGGQAAQVRAGASSPALGEPPHPPELRGPRRREQGPAPRQTATPSSARLDEMIGYVQDGLAVIKDWWQANQEDLDKFAVFPTGYLGMVDRERRARTLRRRAAPGGRAAPAARAVRRPQLPGLHRRARRGLVLPQVPLLQEAGLAGRRLPRRAAGPPERRRAASRRRWRRRNSRCSSQLCGGKLVEGTLYYHYARLIEDLYARRARPRAAATTPTSCPPTSSDNRAGDQP